MLTDLEKVKQEGFDLEYIDNQTDEICLEAVKEIGCALKFVKNQTEEICFGVKDDMVF